VLLGYKLNVEHHVGTAVPSVTSDSEKKGPVIMEIPLDKIRRPLMRTRANDPAKGARAYGQYPCHRTPSACEYLYSSL
jgi:hypothetical protein